MDITVESVFSDKHGFNAPFSAVSLDATGKFWDNLIKYHEDNFVSDFLDLKIEAAFRQESLIDEERIKHNEIRSVRMSPNYEHVGFKSFEAWHADELKAKTSEDKIQKWHNLAKVSEVPEVCAAGIDEETKTSSKGPRMQELIDPYTEARSWNREKTKDKAIRHLNLIARLLDNPRLIDITGRDVVTFARKYIKEFTSEKGKPPSLGVLKDIQSNGSQFVKYWVREEFSENNPFQGVDSRDLGTNEVKKAISPLKRKNWSIYFHCQCWMRTGHFYQY